MAGRRGISYILGCLMLLSVVGCRSARVGANRVAAQPELAATTTAVPSAILTNTAAPLPMASPTSQPPSLTPSPTPPPTETATAVPSSTPLPTVTTVPTATPLPMETPTPTPSPTPEPPPLPAWLTFLNQFRAIAGLPPVLDWEPYTKGSEHHSQYMVVRDQAIAHSEDINDPLYDVGGDQAARNGNIFATSQDDATYIWSLNFWASAPFHLIGMLNPTLSKVGYGDYVEDGGDVVMAAVLDIGSDSGADNGVTYPIYFPGPESSTWIVRHSMYEWPDPITSCPGYTRPSGPPIILFLGNGSVTPSVSRHRLAMGDTPLESCLFDETSYQNPDPYAQKVGRTILDLNDAVVIIPLAPLAADETYTAQIDANGQTYTWRFHTIRRPPEE